MIRFESVFEKENRRPLVKGYDASIKEGIEGKNNYTMNYSHGVAKAVLTYS